MTYFRKRNVRSAAIRVAGLTPLLLLTVKRLLIFARQAARTRFDDLPSCSAGMPLCSQKPSRLLLPSSTKHCVSVARTVEMPVLLTRS